MEYEKELKEAINGRNIRHIAIYLRIATKIMGLNIDDYRRVIKDIHESHLRNPDLDI